jgi:hypothetical protein
LVNHKKAHSSTSADPSSTESIEEVQRRRKNSYIDSSFLEGPSMGRLIRKPDNFDYTTGQIRKHIDTWEGDDEERSPSATRELKCLLIKEFILYYNNKNTKVFDSSAKGAQEYCGPCQLSGIVSLELTGLKNPYFVLFQKIFKFKKISIIDAYLAGTSPSTWRSYKTGWNIFVRFLIEEKISNVDWEDEKTCNRIYQEFLNWAFVGRKIPASSINIACSAISKFMCAFISNFNFASSKFIRSMKRGFMMNHPKKPRYPMTWNPDVLINYYYKNNEDSLSTDEKYQFLQTKIAILLGYLHMLHSQEAWSCEITDKQELKLDFNKGCWLRTIVKNDKTSISDIWIPNIDLLIGKSSTNNNDRIADLFRLS